VENSLNSKHIIYTGLVVTGMIWLTLNLAMRSQVPSVCLTKNMTGLPCPTCGVTDSMVLLLSGDVRGSFGANAAGPFMLLLIITAGIGILRYIVIDRRSIPEVITVMESYVLRKRTVLHLLGIALFFNWLFMLYRHFYQ
jgi:hypothetical protein